MKIVLATNNEHKMAEISAILGAFGITVEGPGANGGMPEVPECGATFAENALVKARAGARYFGAPALADDSGLEAALLGGRPGVYSARYAGPGCTYADNNAKLLGEMAGLTGAERRGRFVCAAAVAFPGGPEYVVEGELFGTIATDPRGAGGFGYDPVFVPDGHGRTLAEMTPDEKNDLSHRRRAFEKLARVLLNLGANGLIEALAKKKNPSAEIQ